MAIHVPGLIGIIVFYLLILVIGLIAGRKKNKTGDTDELLLAGRNLGFFVAVMTYTGDKFRKNIFDVLAHDFFFYRQKTKVAFFFR